MIWVIGSKGMLGAEIARVFNENRISWIGTDREVDITDYSALEKFADKQGTAAKKTGLTVSKGIIPEKINWVINCASFSNVDKADEEKEEAENTNANGPLNIARVTRQMGAKLIHISTDYVFDGKSGIPYTESMEKNPLNTFGTTKAHGEELIEKEMTQYYIIRASWLYGFNGKNFVYSMTKKMNESEEVEVVNDAKGSPTSAVDLANAILKIIQTAEKAKSLFGKNSAIPYGIYHFSNLGEVTWFDFAKKIYALGKKYGRITSDCELKPCTSEEYGSEAARPAYTVLCKDKIQKELKLKIPSWQDSLEKFIKSDRFMIR